MKTQNLKDFLKKSKRLKSSKESTLPVLDNALLENDKLIFTDLDCSIILKGVDFTVKSALIPREFFKKIVDKSKEIDLERKDGKLFIKTESGGNYNIPDEPVEDFPKLPEIPNPLKDEIVPKDVERVIKSRAYVANDDLRPIMNGVNLEEKNVVSTDGNFLAFHSREKKGKFTVHLPAKLLSVIEADHYEVTKDDEQPCGYLSGTRYDYSFHITEGQFPQWKSVIPEKFNSSVTIPVADLKAIIDEAEPASNQETHLGAFTSDTKRGILNLIARDLDFSYGYTTNLKVKNSGDSITIGLHLQKLKKILTTEAYDKVEIKMIEPSRATVINNEILLMPLLLKNENEDDVIAPGDDDLDQPPRKPVPSKTPKRITGKSSPKKSSPKKKETTKTTKKSTKAETQPAGEVYIVDYSEKAIVVAGETKPIKDTLSEKGGRFNPFLKDAEGNLFPGWVFSKKRLDDVKEAIKV